MAIPGDGVSSYLAQVAQNAGGAMNADTLAKLKQDISRPDFRISDQKILLTGAGNDPIATTINVNGLPVALEGNAIIKGNRLHGLSLRKVMGRDISPVEIELKEGYLDISNTPTNGKLSTSLRESMGMITANQLQRMGVNPDAMTIPGLGGFLDPLEPGRSGGRQ